MIKLKELNLDVLEFERNNSSNQLLKLITYADVVVHLAGENRPNNLDHFIYSNVNLTEEICDAIKVSGKKIPLIFTSSIQASEENSYGRSKLAAEQLLLELAEKEKIPVTIYRLPGVFGKWCRPNYNSVVATFCYNIANNLPIVINDPNVNIRLVHIDDVLGALIDSLSQFKHGVQWGVIAPEYSLSVGELAGQIIAFKECKSTLVSERVGVGLTRALYSTYISYLPSENFSYDLPLYRDERGEFVEMLRTIDSGQFAYFTAHPGVTRGGHYHHTKVEKFLVIKGIALFKFRNIVTDAIYQMSVQGGTPKVIQSIPGWTHEIKNTGLDELVVMLWVNEVFDRARPDTITCKV